MQSWDNGDECLVSIVCATYNHENYICEAIDSFLMQETNFSFEIIIHDDASTDSTADIIRKYHARYPNIIKPIFQKENKYSKGRFKPSVYASGYASGKYIARMDADDISPLYRIEKQVEFFREIMFHAKEYHIQKRTIMLCLHTIFFGVHGDWTLLLIRHIDRVKSVVRATNNHLQCIKHMTRHIFRHKVVVTIHVLTLFANSPRYGC